MERPLYKPVGTPVIQLDTPALVVDVQALEYNLKTVHTFFDQHDAKLRPHVSAHRCPVIAHKQLAAGGTVDGISVTTLGEAEIFATHGFSDILVVNKVVTPHKIRRLCALAHQATLTAAVDDPGNVRNLSAAAALLGVTLRVVVDVQARPDQGGIAPGQSLLQLARAVCHAPHLNFIGLMTAINPPIRDDLMAWSATPQQLLQPILEARSLLQQEGVAVEVVSVSGLTTYESAENIPGITEVCTGAYALMDARHTSLMSQLRHAAHVLTTVSSHPEPGTAITDAGQKAIGIDMGLPVVAGISGATATGLSAEHCRLQLDDEAQDNVALGDKIWLTPWDMSTCANLYDQMHIVHDGVLEAVWPVAARGQYR